MHQCTLVWDCIISVQNLCFAKYKKASSLIDAIKRASLCSLSKHHPEGASCYTFQCYAILLYSLSASPDSISNPLNSSRDLSTFQTSANIMALIEALSSASVVYSDSFLERSSYCNYCSLMESLVQHNPDHTSRDSHLVMNNRDKGIYNSLGSSSSLAGIVSSNVSANTAPYFIIAFCNPDGK